MRLGNQTIVRNYTSNLNRNLSQLNKYSEMIQTGRRFSSMAESPSSGVRAMQIRRSMAKNESYMDTAKTANSKLVAAHDQLVKMADLANQVADKFGEAINGTSSTDALKALKGEMERLQEQMLSNANAQFNGNYMFGGTNTSKQPYTLENGELFYNGAKVSDMVDGSGNLKDEYKHLMEDAAYVDLGMGMAKDSNNQIIPSTAFKTTTVGLAYMGLGDKNIFHQTSHMIDLLNQELANPGSVNLGEQNDLLTDLRSAAADVNLGAAEISSKVGYLDYTVNRLTDDIINLSERQNTVETVDPAEAIMQQKMQEYVYNAALAMGQRLLQPTLFSFIS